MGTKLSHASRKQGVLLADFLGPCRMLLFAVVAEIRLRTRRPGVRISPGAPLFPNKTLEISRFGRLGACPSEASRFKRAGQGAARCSQQETRRCGEATAEVALGRSAEPCCRRNSGAWSFSRTLASNVSTTTHFCFVAEDSDMATSVNRRSASFVFLGTPATACSFGRSAVHTGARDAIAKCNRKCYSARRTRARSSTG